MDDLLDGLPSKSTAFILQHNPPSLLTSLPSPMTADLRALIRYILITTQPSAIPASTQSEGTIKIASLSDSSATIIPPAASTPSSTPIPRNNDALSPSPLASSARPMSQLGTTMAAPFTQAGSYLKPTLDVVNPKKWWPGYLTLPKSSPRLDVKDVSFVEPKLGSDLGHDPLPPPEEAASSNEHIPKPSDDIASGDGPHDTSHANEEAAISSPSSPSHPPIDASLSDVSEYEQQVVDHDALEDAMQDTTPAYSDYDGDIVAYPPLPLSPPPPPPLSQLTVRMTRNDDETRTEDRTVVHVHVSSRVQIVQKSN